MIKTFSITKARQNLPELVNKATRLLDEFIITVNGEPAAVLLSHAEYESWKETNEILADKELLQSMKKGEKEIEEGKYITFEELKKELNINV